MRTASLTLSAVLCAALVAGAAWYLRSPAPQEELSAAAAAAATTSAALPPRPPPAACGQAAGAACVEFRSAQYHFSLFHSDQKDVKTYDEGGGAATFTFENFDNAHGFQIFVVPYSGTTISDARFAEDEPSGVRTNLTTLMVDGVAAAAFDSYDENLGDTYEVWFIHDGYLYELTTLKAFAGSMRERLATWQFI